MSACPGLIVDCHAQSAELELLLFSFTQLRLRSHQRLAEIEQSKTMPIYSLKQPDNEARR